MDAGAFGVPGGGDGAVGAGMGAGKGGEEEVGVHANVAEARGGFGGGDAAEAFEHPGADLAEHDVVEGEIAGEADVPVLVEGSGAVGHPPAPGGEGALGGEAVGGGGLAVVAKGAEDGFGAEDAGVEVVVVGLHGAGEDGGPLCLQAIGDDAPVEGDGLLGLEAVGVLAGGGVEVFAVDGGLYLLGEGGVGLAVGGVAEELCGFGKDIGIGIVVGGGGELDGRLRLYGRPIAQAPVGEAGGVQGADVVYISLYGLVVVGEYLRVAIEEVDVPGDDGDGTGPVGAIAPFVAPAAGGNDGGQNAVGLLLVAVVGEPLFVDGNAVEIIEAGFAGYVGIACPAVLFALGAIGGVPEKVGKVRGVGGGIDAVKQGIGGVDVAYLQYIAVHEVCGDIAVGEAEGLVADDLGILKAFVAEAGQEGLRAVAAEVVAIGTEGVGGGGGWVACPIPGWVWGQCSRE